MEVKQQPRLSFTGVDIASINYNAFNRMNEKGEVKIDIRPKVFYPDTNQGENGVFKIIMETRVSSDDFFEIEIIAIGHFQVIGDISDEIRNSFVNVNAPAIMFPYVRSFVSTLTSNCGTIIHPLQIPTQFFKGELEEFKESSIEQGSTLED